jgi:hypothetical protein
MAVWKAEGKVKKDIKYIFTHIPSKFTDAFMYARLAWNTSKGSEKRSDFDDNYNVKHLADVPEPVAELMYGVHSEEEAKSHLQAYAGRGQKIIDQAKYVGKVLGFAVEPRPVPQIGFLTGPKAPDDIKVLNEPKPRPEDVKDLT